MHQMIEPREWFRVQAKGAKNAEVLIYDAIGRDPYDGSGVSPDGLYKEVNALGLGSDGELMVRINSPGGNFWDGNAIYNFLRSIKARVRVRVDGIAASAASIIAMAGDRIEMPANSILFIHNPWMMVVGDAQTMRKAAEELEGYKENAIGTYMRRAGNKLSRAKLSEMLDAETALSAEDSVKYGLADVVDEPLRVAALARHDLTRTYGQRVPAALRDAIAHAKRQMLRDALTAARAAG